MKLVLDVMRIILVALALPILPLEAQTFNLLHTFASSGQGYIPAYYPMVVAGNTLYGVTSQENTNGVPYNSLGDIFKINTDGSGYTNLYKFSYYPGGPTNGADGDSPQGLILVGNTLYGTTSNGGTNGNGSIYSIQTDGTGFKILYTFGGFTDGGFLQGTVVLYSNMLYGTAFAGGHRDSRSELGTCGTIYAVGTNGTGFTNLFYFDYTNGAEPMGALVVSAGKIYGTTSSGGSGGKTNGTIYALNTDGTGFTNYHSFSGYSALNSTNYDGGYVLSGLLLVGDTLYGQTGRGGTNGTGAIFAINTNGGDFRTIFNFNYTDGLAAYSGLAFANGRLYGTTCQAFNTNYSGSGAPQSGNVYSIRPDGTDFNDLFHFPILSGSSGGGYYSSTNSDGAQPVVAVVISGNSLYGITPYGGTNGAGTIYSIDLPPQPVSIPLDARLMNGALILSWTNSSFALQSSPEVAGAYTNVVGATSPYTNTLTANQQFFRLQY